MKEHMCNILAASAAAVSYEFISNPYYQMFIWFWLAQ